MEDTKSKKQKYVIGVMLSNSEVDEGAVKFLPFSKHHCQSCVCVFYRLCKRYKCSVSELAHLQASIYLVGKQATTLLYCFHTW